MKIFNPTSLLLNLNYKNFNFYNLKIMTKMIFWDLQKQFEWLLRVKIVNICNMEILGFYWKKIWKIDDFDAHFFIWSSKIPKVVFMYYERSIFCHSIKYSSFYQWVLEFRFFWFRKLVSKGILSNPATALDLSKKC